VGGASWEHLNGTVTLSIVERLFPLTMPCSVKHSTVLFPVTLAFSLGERENFRLQRETLSDVQIIAAHGKLVGLPIGNRRYGRLEICATMSE
jgi:hypothetical protein